MLNSHTFARINYRSSSPLQIFEAGVAQQRHDGWIGSKLARSRELHGRVDVGGGAGADEQRFGLSQIALAGERFSIGDR